MPCRDPSEPFSGSLDVVGGGGQLGHDDGHDGNGGHDHQGGHNNPGGDFAAVVTEDRRQPGVAHKRLGSFTERALQIGFIRLEEGATLAFGTARAPEVATILSGTIRGGDTDHGPFTTFSTTTEESPVELTARDATELYYLKMPTY